MMWSEMFSDDGEYLMYLLPLEVTDHLSFARFDCQGADLVLANQIESRRASHHSQTY